MVATAGTTHPLTLFSPDQGSARDAYGREMTYLRISLTDRCNFRCLYCMPAIGMKFQPRDEILTDEELIHVVGAFSEVGFTKFRLTGGEPTIRPHLVDIVREIKKFPNVDEITMTTNALLLGRMADDLAAAGMNRINVSLDTLDADRFKIMTRGGRFDMVWDGILAAENAGMTPIKINTVVLRGQNEHEVADLARLTIDKPWQMRFLEIMPMEGVGPVYDESLVTSEETQLRLEHTFGPLEHVASPPGDPARIWKIPGAQGTIGFISPISEPFCSTCNRVRLSADGKLRLCLLRSDEIDLRETVRNGGSRADLTRQIRAGIWRKPWGHGIAEGDFNIGRGMSQIGG
jgi:GTP 3',8-cyclase